MNNSPSIEQQLRFFAVRVNSGSGCIFDSETVPYTCILTAAHNVPPGEDVNVFRFLDQDLPLKVKNVYQHPNLDLALIIVDKIPEHAYRCAVGQPARDEELIVFGYPQRLENEKETREELKAKCGPYHENQSGFELTVEGLLFSFSKDAAENVIGMSGSGIYASQDGNLILKGILYELKAEGGVNNKLNALFPDGFDKIINDHSLDLAQFGNKRKESPYKGIDRFGEADWPFYFGRDEEIRKMFRSLRESKFASIFGTSGSGKSSLVRAGLGKGLSMFGGTFPKSLDTLIFDVSLSPASALTAALSNFHSERNDSKQPYEGDVVQVMEQIITNEPNKQLVLVIDQFERLVNRETSTGDVQAFVDIVLAAHQLGIPLIIAARVDYYAALVALPGLGQLIADNIITIFPLPKEALYEVINAPAQKNNCLVESGLSSQLILDTYRRNNALVLLQLAMYHLWQSDAATGMLTMSTFRKQSTFDDLYSNKTFTGVEGILVRLAEEKYLELSADEQSKLPFVFISLLTTYEGATKLSDVNVSTKKAYLTDFDHQTKIVAQKMADSFLLTSGYDENARKDTVEIGHEALLVQWPRLRGWVEKYENIIVWMTSKFNPHYDIYKKGDRRHYLPRAESRDGLRWAKQFPPIFTQGRMTFLKRSRNHQRVIAISTALVVLGVIGFFFLAIRTREKENFAKANDNLQKGLLAIREKNYNSALSALNESLKYRSNDEIKENLLFAKMLSSVEDSRQLPAQFAGISPDGRYAVLWGKSKVVIWNIAGNKSVFEIQGDTVDVTKVSFSKKGDLVAIGNKKGQLKIANTLTKHVVSVTTTDITAIASVAFSPDGRWISWGNESNDLSIALVAATSTPIKLTPASAPIWSICFSPDSKFLALGDGQKKLHLLENIGNRWHSQFQVLAGTDVINTLTFNQQGTLIATGISDGSIGLYNAANGKLIYYATGHKSEIADLEFSPSGKYLLSAGEDDAIKLWTVYPFNEVLKIYEKNKEPFRVAFCEQDSKFSVGYKNKTVSIWTADHSIYSTLSDGLSQMYAIAVERDGKWAVTAETNSSIYTQEPGFKNFMRVWDLQVGKPVKTIPTSAKEHIVSLAISHDGRFLASASENGQVTIHNTSTWTAIDSVTYPRTVCVVKFDGTGMLYIGGRQNKQKIAPIYFYDIGNKHLDSLLHVGGSVFDISTSYQGDTFATGGGDRTIRLWSRNRMKELRNLPGSSRSVWAVSLSPDNKLLAVGLLDRTLQVFENWTKRPPSEFKDHEGGILTVAFHPKDRIIASAGDDHTVRIRNLGTNQSIVLRNSNYPIWSLQFSSDGNTLYTCNLGGEISKYNLPEILRFMK